MKVYILTVSDSDGVDKDAFKSKEEALSFAREKYVFDEHEMEELEQDGEMTTELNSYVTIEELEIKE